MFKVGQVYRVEAKSSYTSGLDKMICQQIMDKIGSTFIIERCSQYSVYSVRGVGGKSYMVVKADDIKIPNNSGIGTLFNRRDVEAKNITLVGEPDTEVTPKSRVELARRLVKLEEEISVLELSLARLDSLRSERVKVLNQLS